MAGGDLWLSDLALLGTILARRDPDLVAAIDRGAADSLTREQRERIRRVVVDELCELPEDAGDRRALELEEVLIHLGTA
jgi:hypothetical protein